MYRMDKNLYIADKATVEIEAWLSLDPRHFKVINVENSQKYRNKDIDLIWLSQGGKCRTFIEIKCDTWHKTKNFFFETHSNVELAKPGCFMYTECNYLFYYFLHIRELYILPMPLTREWFLTRMNDFVERHTQTPIGNGKKYTSLGRCVPIAVVMSEVPGVKMHQLQERAEGA